MMMYTRNLFNRKASQMYVESIIFRINPRHCTVIKLESRWKSIDYERAWYEFYSNDLLCLRGFYCCCEAQSNIFFKIFKNLKEKKLIKTIGTAYLLIQFPWIYSEIQYVSIKCNVECLWRLLRALKESLMDFKISFQYVKVLVAFNCLLHFHRDSLTQILFCDLLKVHEKRDTRWWSGWIIFVAVQAIFYI